MTDFYPQSILTEGSVSRIWQSCSGQEQNNFSLAFYTIYVHAYKTHLEYCPLEVNFAAHRTFTNVAFV